MGSDLRDIVEISSKYIKPLSAAFLTGDRNAQVTTEVILQLIKSGPNIDERWELVSDFMKLFASYEKTRANQSAVREMILGNIFARIARDMCAETSTAEWMSVRAVPSQGKSVFLSLEYIYLMAYKYKLLSSSGQLDGFTAERKAEFTHVEPQTALGQKIYRILIG